MFTKKGTKIIGLNFVLHYQSQDCVVTPDVLNQKLSRLPLTNKYVVNWNLLNKSVCCGGGNVLAHFQYFREICFNLDRGSQTRGPRITYGPRHLCLWPAYWSEEIFLKIIIEKMI